MPGEVKLPGVGPVSRRALLLGGAGAAAVMGVLWWRKRHGAAAASPAADTATTDLSGLDTGGSGMAGGGGSLTGPSVATTSGPTSNQAWTALVMQALGGVADPQALSEALGLFLTGSAVSHDQELLIDQAIAVAGYPPTAGPGGYPPAIHTQPASGQTKPADLSIKGLRQIAPGEISIAPGEITIDWEDLPGVLNYRIVRDGGAATDISWGSAYTSRRNAPHSVHTFTVQAIGFTGPGPVSVPITTTAA